MRKIEKSLKWPPPNRYRRRMHLSLDPDTYEFLTNEVHTASRFIDEVIQLLRVQPESEEKTIIKKNREISGLVVIRTRDLRRVKAAS